MLTLTHLVYEAWVDNDFNQSSLVGYFMNEDDAKKAVKGKSSWGGDGRVHSKILDIKVFESYEEFEDSRLDSIREAALKKLTDEEKKALKLI